MSVPAWVAVLVWWKSGKKGLIKAQNTTLTVTQRATHRKIGPLVWPLASSSTFLYFFRLLQARCAFRLLGF